MQCILACRPPFYNRQACRAYLCLSIDNYSAVCRGWPLVRECLTGLVPKSVGVSNQSIQGVRGSGGENPMSPLLFELQMQRESSPFNLNCIFMGWLAGWLGFSASSYIYFHLVFS